MQKTFKKQKKKNSNPHTQFQATLRKIAGLFGCRIEIFYDTIIPRDIWYNPLMSNLSIKLFVIGLIAKIRDSQKQAPFDCVLITPTNVFCIELKVGSDKQKKHQLERELLMRKINPHSYYVIRKWEQTKNKVLKTTVYDIIQDSKVVCRCYDITEIIQWFKEVK